MNDHPKPRLLAIDDTPVNLLTLGSALKQEFDLQLATSGEMGLSLALQSRPDLILLDIMMPGIDGFETCRRLKSYPQLQDVPVMFVTALDQPEFELKGLELGVVDYITKPIQVGIARQRIRNALEREQLRQQLLTSRNQLATEVAARQKSQQRAEKLLIEQKAMLENELVGIVRVARRIILWANPAFEAMMGYGPGELVGTATRRNYLSEQASEELAQAAYPVLARGGIYRTQLEHVRKDGRRIWVDMSGATLDADTGESLWAFLDITERQQANQALQRHLRFSQSINDIAHAILTLDHAEQLLTDTVRTVGEALNVDRALIYEVSFERGSGVGICEWLNPQHPEVQSTRASYPLKAFKHTSQWLWEARQSLVSHQTHPAEALQTDGIVEMVHEKMAIRSLLWLPFCFQADGYHLLVLNQVLHERQWLPDESSFLAAVSQQVTLALNKIRLLREREKNEDQLKLAASVFASAREGIFIAALDGTILNINEAFTRITGYSRADVLGQTPRLLNSGQQDRAFYEAMWRQISAKGHWYGEIWNRRKNGEIYAEMLTISTVPDALGQPQNYVALFSDITALKAHERELDHIAHYDVLTDLPNRALLADRLRQGMTHALRRQQQIAVVFLDLDGFKAVNDTHGHEAGDQLLMAVARRMKQTLREGDTLARIGGDEFVAVLVDFADAHASVPMLSRLLSAAAQPVTVGSAELQVSASLGVTFYPQAEDIDAEQLMRQADQAMYQAKLAGKNRFHIFDTARDSGQRSYRESLQRIRQALAAQELVLHYQPKVNMRTGEVIGVEALIRWQHPEKGLLAPATFLPTIEDDPLAVDVGEWVIDTALTQLEEWQQQGLKLSISVNIGARQLQQRDFAQRLRELLSLHPNVRPGDLELEVLETSALDDIMRVSQVITQCREMGVTFALDDFGTGYSTLNYLKLLPVQTLKIDRSFVRDILDDEDDRGITEAVVRLAEVFGRKLVAEGVESVEQGVLLMRLGCDVAQGFGVARPMPAHQVAPWLADYSPDAAWGQWAHAQWELQDMPLLVAQHDHLIWVKHVIFAVEGEPLGLAHEELVDHHECRFGHWYYRHGMARYGHLDEFRAIEPIHARVHQVAPEILRLHSEGHTQSARALCQELLRLKDEIVRLLATLQWVVLHSLAQRPPSDPPQAPGLTDESAPPSA